MRASGISVFTKNVTSLSRRSALGAGAAALVISAGLPLLPGAFSASACGAPEAAATDRPTATATANGTAKRSGSNDYRPDPAADFGTPLPHEITTGGAPVEFDLTLRNLADVRLEKVAPMLSINATAHTDRFGGEVRPQDLSVEVRHGGAWQKLAVVRYCDPGNRADTSEFAQPMDPGDRLEFHFRVGLAAGTARDVDSLDLFGGITDQGKSASFTMKVLRPGPTQAPSTAPATPTSTPTTTAPTPAATASAVPAGVVGTAPTASPTAPATAAASELAHTGGSSPNGFLLGSAASFVVLGAGTLIAVRRLRNQG
ncbi:hypothetical protein [Kitasatospora sp. NBC_00315]|uniref:hypothetical protein n=1 Tax=Kitasatospora sp. NBC_00315 TaxID=2975963 RepID=UPI0032529ED1